MTDIFIKLLNMSLTASWLILAVVLFRLLFAKAPKTLRVVLWGLVALRLLVPFSWESVFSLIPSAEPIPEEITAQTYVNGLVLYADEPTLGFQTDSLSYTILTEEELKGELKIIDGNLKFFVGDEESFFLQ